MSLSCSFSWDCSCSTMIEKKNKYKNRQTAFVKECLEFSLSFLLSFSTYYVLCSFVWVISSYVYSSHIAIMIIRKNNITMSSHHRYYVYTFHCLFILLDDEMVMLLFFYPARECHVPSSSEVIFLAATSEKN